MSQTLWLFVLFSVVGLISGQLPFLPGVPDVFGGQNPLAPEPGHGLIDGSFVKVREQLIKNIRLVAGGGDDDGKDHGSDGHDGDDKKDNDSSSSGHAAPAFPTLPGIPGLGVLPNFQPFQPLPYVRQNN